MHLQTRKATVCYNLTKKMIPYNFFFFTYLAEMMTKRAYQKRVMDATI